MLRLFHGQADPFFNRVCIENPDLDDVPDLKHLAGVLDIFIADLRDVYQPVLVDADIHKGAEIDHVAYRAGKLHAGLQVFQFQNIGAEQGGRQLVSGVPSRF